MQATVSSAQTKAPCPRRKAPAAPPRPAFVVLAQCDHGPIAAVVCTSPAAWKDEAVRLQGAQFDGNFERHEFTSVENAETAISELAIEVKNHFGLRPQYDMLKAKVFLADFPIVSEIFGRVRKMVPQ